MRRKKVLIVCMFDSIHAGRWLSQFTDQEIDFVLFPSKKFKRIHPKLLKLINDKSPATFSVSHPLRIVRILGYLDFALFVQIPKIIKINLRARYLRKLLHKEKFDYVHALEIQGAGYLCDEAIDKKDFKFILTNWGSDIFYFQHLPEHLPKIESALAKADLYSAECNRDYKLALDLGFKGVQLPCIPNGGGLIDSEILDIGIPASERKNIVVKAYGGTFGRGALAIEAVSKALLEYRDLTAYFYSVTEDLIGSVEDLAKTFGSRIGFSTTKNPISHSELSKIFEKSRIYIGCSVSDGISTSFLEALAKGVYPIQTITSCAGEWISKGAVASLVDLDKVQLEIELFKAVVGDQLVDEASESNRNLANNHLNFDKISKIAQDFYLQR
ncbi:GT4_PimA-like domain containing protein [actinobacterium SCGC AAA044-D11]